MCIRDSVCTETYLTYQHDSILCLLSETQYQSMANRISQKKSDNRNSVTDKHIRMSTRKTVNGIKQGNEIKAVNTDFKQGSY